MRDSDVREVMRAELAAQHAGDSDTRMVEEMGVWSGSVRIDIAVINGELGGYELKSARDNLERLPFQRDLYGEVFDRLTLVTAENHLKGALATVPDWWGFIVARPLEGTIALEQYREAEINPQPNILQVARLLWRSEALEILEGYGLSKGLRSKPSDLLSKRLSTELPHSVLSAEVRSALKRRKNWLG